MSLEDKVRATAKEAEGKLQAAAGELSGDEKMKEQGEAKQVQAQVIATAGTLKDKAHEAAGPLGDALDQLTGKQS